MRPEGSLRRRWRQGNAKGRTVGKDAQHGDDLLAVTPAHLAHGLDARDQIYRAARPEEQAVALYQKARHAYRLGVCYPMASVTRHQRLPLTKG